jgi:hypothetical protein
VSQILFRGLNRHILSHKTGIGTAAVLAWNRRVDNDSHSISRQITKYVFDKRWKLPRSLFSCILLVRMSGTAEADERLFEIVQEVTARYMDALVADLNGGGASQRVRVEVSEYELEIANVRLAMKYK